MSPVFGLAKEYYLLATWRGNIGDDDRTLWIGQILAVQTLLPRFPATRSLPARTVPPPGDASLKPARGIKTRLIADGNVGVRVRVRVAYCMWLCDPGVAGQHSHSDMTQQLHSSNLSLRLQPCILSYMCFDSFRSYIYIRSPFVPFPYF